MLVALMLVAVMLVAVMVAAWQHSRTGREELMGAYSTVDVLAVGFFILEWTVYAVTLEHTAYGRDSLSARMHLYREIFGSFSTKPITAQQVPQ